MFAVPTTSTLPSIIAVDPDLKEIEVNSTYAKVGWRTFSVSELQFIDGVQLRYKEIDDKVSCVYYFFHKHQYWALHDLFLRSKVYAATPLIHRAVTTYTIEELKPDSIYEVGIFFIPFPGQTTELQAQRTIVVRTSIENGKIVLVFFLLIKMINYSILHRTYVMSAKGMFSLLK